ncbi:hypothetical protein JX265_006594 [Neoarthrinium moseri]|uniref:Heterokaryon incompatibility domain-containing protein n=1 Tax=Neoarthrinium moseri TaxID=1658444 RepID=A0A9P9WLK9_9PEZI|nr:uncharacterized protein JN550_003034 [Neoarthrinium moseri]KAI1855263.1 hypothetical protein JX266_000128 [Neoarthrinium moseri]KAI1869504.1 hypothetical protein JX265_006594 [Neoarthrinium moseri]KAI1873765.1 hypothetical protein JN550_003034 [Neoarthrinium moseri]
MKSLRADPFSYTPLPLPSSIRLLKIEPGSPTDIVRCSIRSVDLKKPPSFTALSYSWMEDKLWSVRGRDAVFEKLSGLFLRAQMRWKIPQLLNASDTDGGRGLPTTQTIFCNGMSVKVHASLYSALLQLRKCRVDEEYWIDAICMNQADDQEKTQQVQMMGQIYSAAQLVLVWLGPSPTYLDPGFAHLDCFIDNALSKWVDTASASDPVPTKVKDDELLTDPDFLAFLALIHLVSRRYFRRTWVLQETGLARKVTFLLGEIEFGQEKLQRCVAVANGPLLDRPSALPYFPSGLKAVISPWIERVEKLPIANAGGHETSNRGGDWSLHQWLMMCAERKAGDSRDMVFAGLSLISPEFLHIRQDLQLSEFGPPPPLPPRPSKLLEDKVNNTYSLTPPPPATFILNQVSHDSLGEPNPPLLPPRPGSTLITQPSDASPQQKHSMDHTRLWPKLQVDYTASIRHVALNLAACLLSGQDADTLLSISSQFQARNGSLGKYCPEAPSWIPPLSRGKRMFSQRIENIGGPTSSFSSATQLRGIPIISADGSALYLDGVRLGRVEKRIDPPNHIDIGACTYDANSDGADDLLRLVTTINSFPRNYRDTDISTLAAVADVCTLGVLRYDPMGFQNITQGFCLYIHDKIRETVKPKKKGKREQKETDTRGPKMETEVMKEVRMNIEARREEELKNQKEQLPGAYRDLREAYPEMQWLEASTKLGEEEKRLRDLFSAHSALGSMLSPWRMFTTDTGYIGLGPTELRQGDEVVLIKGANVPYLFRHADAALRWQIEDIKVNLFLLEQHKSLDGLEMAKQDLRDLEALIGTKDGYVLVGEAYVEGIMDGEVISEYVDRFERITVV